MIRTHINVATTDGGARRRAYQDAADRAGTSLNRLIFETLDKALLTKRVRDELPKLTARKGAK